MRDYLHVTTSYKLVAFTVILLISILTIMTGCGSSGDGGRPPEEIVSPLVGTWGFAVLEHGSWRTEGGRFTLNKDGTGTVTYKMNNDGTLSFGTNSFTYSSVTNTDGSISITSTNSDGTDTKKVVLSDDGKMMIQDGTVNSNGQEMFVAVKLDTSKSYSNADLKGDYFVIGYEHNSNYVAPPYGNGSYMAISSIATDDGSGNCTYHGWANSDGTIWENLPGRVYSCTVSPDGTGTYGNETGYGSGDGKLGVMAITQDPAKWGLYFSMKRQDRTYSTSDIAGTWALAGFGDDSGTSFNAEFGTMTCDSSGNCTASSKNQRDGNITYESGNVTLSVASDGSFGGSSIGDMAPSYAGAIGNNGNTMIFNVSFDSTTTYHREIVIGVRCSKCKNLNTSGDTTAPTLISSNPANGATNVSVSNRTVSFTFNEAMQSGYSVLWSDNVNASNFTRSWSSDNKTITYTYNSDFPANSTISWTLNPSGWSLSFKDLAGNPLPADIYSGSFMTGIGGATTYTASGTYTYNSGTGALTLNTTSSNFVCEGPSAGTDSLTVTTLTATSMQIQGVELTWTRPGGTAGDIVGTWTSFDSSSGNSWEITFNSDGTFSLVGHIAQCTDLAQAYSQHWNSGYYAAFYVHDPTHQYTSVMVTGPYISGSLSLTYFTYSEGNWQSSGGGIFLGSTPPTPLLTYNFTLVSGTGTTNLTDTIEAFVVPFATNLYPSGGQVVSSNPTFSWTGAGSGYTYMIEVRDSNGNGIWDSSVLTTTSVVYAGPALTSGATYYYNVLVRDTYGNWSAVQENFIVQ